MRDTVAGKLIKLPLQRCLLCCGVWPLVSATIARRMGTALFMISAPSSNELFAVVLSGSGATLPLRFVS